MNILKPVFYDEFSCVGSDCLLTCCGGWCITVDEKTLKKYRKMGGEIARFARHGVCYNEDKNSNVVKLQKKGCCPMLNEEQLCRVVLEKGPAALCHTCRIYPRVSVHSFDTVEQYLSMGCPRVVQLLFQMENKLTFVFEEDASMQTQELPVFNKKIYVNMKVRDSIVDFIQKSSLPLWFRKFYGAYVIQKMLPDIRAEDFDAVVQKTEHFLDASFCQEFYERIKDNATDRQQQFQVLREIILKIDVGICKLLFWDVHGYSGQVLDLLNLNKDCSFEQWNNARETWEKERNLFHQENMLVYNWVLRAFVPQKEHRLLKNYIASVLINLLVNHFMILYSIHYPPTEQMETVITALMTRVVQSGNIVDILQQEMENGVLSPAFLLRLCNI